MSRPYRSRAPAPAGPAWARHWSAVSGTTDPDRCYLCRRRQRAAECEEPARIAEVLWQRSRGRPLRKESARPGNLQGLLHRYP